MALFFELTKVSLFTLFYFDICMSLPLDSLTPLPKSKWTVAVYMNGDNELEPSITGGIGGISINPARLKNSGSTLKGDFHYELAKLGSQSEVIHVIALVDRSPKYAKTQDNWSNTRLYYVETDDFPNNAGTYWVNESGKDELNMADPQSLLWFIETAQHYFPSDHMFLSLWDHNWGWHAGWFQKDETSGSDTMNYSDLKESLLSLNTSGRIDLVGYDACVSSQLEVLHTWRPYSSTFIGSQDYVGWGGIDYSVVIEAIHNDPSISPGSLALVIAESMLTDADDHCASVVLMDSGSFDNLVMYTSKLAAVFISHIESIRERLIVIREQVPQTPHYPADEFHRDLHGLAVGVIDGLNDYPDIVDVAVDIIRTFNSSVVYNKVVGKSCSGGMGLSIYWPRSKEFSTLSDSAEYLLLSFSKATQWDEFLQLF